MSDPYLSKKWMRLRNDDHRALCLSGSIPIAEYIKALWCRIWVLSKLEVVITEF
jgi:hypothetical protein